jgi:predicted RNA methylase
MTPVHVIERARQERQKALDAEKTQQERNRLGQFATPAALANDIMAYAKRLLPKPGAIRFMDPALGTGSFYSALLRTVPQRRIASARGFEIDPAFAQAARHLWGQSGLNVTTGDFTRHRPPHDENDKVTLLVTNPPYVRHHHLSIAEKARLQSLVASAAGLQLSGLAGLYCYFLLLSHPWMAKGAIASWLIPSEFLDVNYGGKIKEYLLRRVTLLRIHRFDPNDVQFDDALVSSAVVWFRKEPPPAGHTVQFTYGGTHVTPARRKDVPADVLSGEAKWTPLFKGNAKGRTDAPTMADLFTIRRGIATGANEFFILAREEAARRHLPDSVLTPILPSPRYLESDEVLADKDGFPSIERQLVLVDCALSEDEVERRYSVLAAYLAEGKVKGVDQTYLCSHRQPWYAQEARPAPLFLCTYMGRGEKARPFRFILNHSRAIAANVYLLLYPKPPLQRLLQQDPANARRVWQALNTLSAETLMGGGRVYGGGLYKMEPKELANAPADAILHALPALHENLGTQTRLFDDP